MFDDASQTFSNPFVSDTYCGPDEIVKLISSFTTTARRLPNDPLFANTHQLLLLNHLPGINRLGVYSVLEDRTTPTTNGDPLVCNILGCLRSFNTDKEFQRHYNRSHRYQCSQCHRMLPSEHLLDLHLSEEHDSFFAARVAAHPETAWFACFLKECTTVCHSPDGRKDHCIRDHQFPTHFRFDTIHHKTHKTPAPTVKEDEANCSLRFVNFGHSKQKTFLPKKSYRGKHNPNVIPTKCEMMEEDSNSLMETA